MKSPRERGRHFVIADRSFDLSTGQAAFDYELDGIGFTERVKFPVSDHHAVDPAATELLLDLCHLLIGTSYYKLTAPRTITLSRAVPPEFLVACTHAYDEGLREFCTVNSLPIPLPFELRAEVMRSDLPATEKRVACPIVPIGGGKDSAAVLALVSDAAALAVSPTDIQRRLARAAGAPLLEVTRELDPGLWELTPSGFNGHIPVTAIHSAVSAMAAHLNGYDSVIMGNERSASEPTRVVDGFAVNHQYSKSFDFELILHVALGLAGITYFSLLRQLSEISIAGIVAQQCRLRTNFLSCNRAFVRSRCEDEPQLWCLRCAKCLFTFLCFAPFLDVDSAHEIFGGNPLADAALIEDFRALWGNKPFDCVGERGEAAAAVTFLASDPRWRTMPTVVALADDALKTQDSLGVSIRSLLAPEGPTLSPAPFGAIAADAARAIDDPHHR